MSRIQTELKTHTRVSPSYLATAIPCPAGVTLAGDVESKSGPAARLGTAKHEAVDLLLRGKTVPSIIEVEGEAIVVDEEFMDDVLFCVRFAQSLEETCDIFETETKTDLDWYYKPEPPPVPFSGHVDCFAYSAKKSKAYIVDFKFGSKIVSIDGPQTPAYTLMLLGRFGSSDLPQTFDLVIVQPSDKENPIKRKTVTLKELLHWGATVLDPALKRIAAGDVTENPGDAQCQWCRRSGECRSLQARSLEVVKEAFNDEPSTLPTGGLSDGEIAYILDNAERVEAWLRSVRAEASKRIERGAEIPNWKLVEKRANRKWSDEKLVSARLSDEEFRDLAPEDILTLPELRSPAQIEKAFKRNGLDFKKLEPFITRESSGTTLAPESDKRAAVTGGDVALFFND